MQGVKDLHPFDVADNGHNPSTEELQPYLDKELRSLRGCLHRFLRVSQKRQAVVYQALGEALVMKGGNWKN